MILAILALVAGTVFAPAQERQERVANGIAAIANDSVITWQEVRQEAGDALDLYQRTYYNQPAELERRRLAAMTESLEHLIDRQLMLFDFKTLGIVIPESK